MSSNIDQSVHLFKRGGSAKVRQKSVLEQSIEGDLVLDAIDAFEEQNDGRFVLRRQTGSHRGAGHHLRLTVLSHHLPSIMSLITKRPRLQIQWRIQGVGRGDCATAPLV